MKNNFVDKKVIKMDISSLKREIVDYIIDLINGVNHYKKTLVEVDEEIKYLENRNK